MAGAIFTLILVGLAVAVGAFVLGHHLGKSTDAMRRREVRALKMSLANVTDQVDRIEELALTNTEGFVLSVDILKITRTKPKG